MSSVMPMPFIIRPMSDASAEAIAGWRYPPPYDFYDAIADDPDLADLLSADFRHELSPLVGAAPHRVGAAPQPATGEQGSPGTSISREAGAAGARAPRSPCAAPSALAFLHAGRWG